MARRRRFPLLFLLIAILVVVVFFVWRSQTRAATGPAIALCPGPDQYGYRCESGTGFAYIDATEDTRLYADDAVIGIDLPFPFTFYGTTYTTLYASSNGNVQFGSENGSYSNTCLQEGPASNMGDMIAPFWDDLNLTFFGYLETEVVGEAPERIFVIEWDNIPRFSEFDEDTVTFELQLFEGSNDILFLYEVVASFSANNGSSATIGLQSELQQMALAYSCDQPAVSDASRLYFPHPQEPDRNAGLETILIPAQPESIQAKGDTAELMQQLAQRGTAVLPRIRADWLNQPSPRMSEWHRLDLTSSPNDELVVLRYGRSPQFTQLTVIGWQADQQPMLLFDEQMSTRLNPVTRLKLIASGDVAGDGQTAALLVDETNNQLFLLAAQAEKVQITAVPQQCQGGLILQDMNNDQKLDIVRDGCSTSGRISYTWDGSNFHQLP